MVFLLKMVLSVLVTLKGNGLEHGADCFHNKYMLRNSYPPLTLSRQRLNGIFLPKINILPNRLVIVKMVNKMMELPLSATPNSRSNLERPVSKPV